MKVKLPTITDFFLPMTPRARILLALITGMIIGLLTTLALSLGWIVVQRNFGGQVAVIDLIVWLTLSLWFFVFIKWVQGKDLSNRLKLLEIRKLEMQVALTLHRHPELKELPA